MCLNHPRLSKQLSALGRSSSFRKSLTPESRSPTPPYRIGMRAYECGFPRTPLLGSSVNRGNPSPEVDGETLVRNLLLHAMSPFAGLSPLTYTPQGHNGRGWSVTKTSFSERSSVGTRGCALDWGVDRLHHRQRS